MVDNPTTEPPCMDIAGLKIIVQHALWISTSSPAGETDSCLNFIVTNIFPIYLLKVM